jgi:hypothetical protein
VLCFGERLSVIFLTLALVAGQAGVCAGWLPTPEARMACCSDDRPCPMHESHSQDAGSERIVSQAEADRCCAASGHDDSAPSPANAVFFVTPAVNPVPALFSQPYPHPVMSRAALPLATAHVPKHVLLSVFLV